MKTIRFLLALLGIVLWIFTVGPVFAFVLACCDFIKYWLGSTAEVWWALRK